MGYQTIISLIIRFASSLLILYGAPGLGEVMPYPGSTVTYESVDQVARNHQIVMGPVKRVNTQLVAESSEFVWGTKRATTYEITHENRGLVVKDFFREQLLRRAKIIFECGGRSCGSSNYWANAIFKQPILYGPKRHQHYFLAQGNMQVNHDTYLIVYIAQRGTGKLYTHIEIIDALAHQSKIDKDLIHSALRRAGKYSFQLEKAETLLVALRDVVLANPTGNFALVVHDKLQANETLEAALLRTSQGAKILRARLITLGVGSTTLQAYGLGPLSPVDSQHVARVELVLIAAALNTTAESTPKMQN